MSNFEHLFIYLRTTFYFSVNCLLCLFSFSYWFFTLCPSSLRVLHTSQNSPGDVEYRIRNVVNNPI